MTDSTSRKLLETARAAGCQVRLDIWGTIGRVIDDMVMVEFVGYPHKLIFNHDDVKINWAYMCPACEEEIINHDGICVNNEEEPVTCENCGAQIMIEEEYHYSITGLKKAT